MTEMKTENLDRRGFLAGLLAGSAVIGLAPLEGFTQPLDAVSRTLSGNPQQHLPGELASLFHYIRPGVGVIEGWTISNVTWEEGAVRVSIIGEKEEVIVDICRRQGVAQGVEHTDHLDFFVMNDGKTNTRTGTSAHQSVRIIREVLDRMDVDAESVVAGMRSHTERLALTDAGILRFG